MKTLLLIGLLGLAACRGPEGIQGRNGSPGNNGSTGALGPVGATGPAGTPGVNPTPTTIVELCPGVTTYPGVFVEVGICLQGQLYAVYSANGGFLTLLAPGTYTSNAIGSACTLTVAANCKVTH